MPVPLTRGIQMHPPSPCGGLPTPALTCACWGVRLQDNFPDSGFSQEGGGGIDNTETWEGGTRGVHSRRFHGRSVAFHAPCMAFHGRFVAFNGRFTAFVGRFAAFNGRFIEFHAPFIAFHAPFMAFHAPFMAFHAPFMVFHGHFFFFLTQTHKFIVSARPDGPDQ